MLANDDGKNISLQLKYSRTNNLFNKFIFSKKLCFQFPYWVSTVKALLALKTNDRYAVYE